MMTVASHKENSSFITMPHDKGVDYTDDYDETVAEIEALLEEDSDDPQSMEDLENNATKFANASASRLPFEDDPYATEYSSSFSGTMSGGESISGTSDAEVESEYHGHNQWASLFGGYNSISGTRKKKVTSQWRNFIRPLMWRCKWTELKIKELEAQAAKYSQALGTSDQNKALDQHQYSSEFFPQPLPSVSHCLKSKSMKRRRRKQVEKVTDVSSYMSDHHIFSYIENKKTDPEGLSSARNYGDTDPCPENDEFSIPVDWFRDDESPLEHVQRKIEKAHSRVLDLVSRLHTVMLDNGVKPPSRNLSLLDPCEAQTSSGHSPTLSAGNGDALSIGAISSHLMSDFDFGDLALPECMSYGDATHIPDIIESTVGLLSAADVTMHQQHIMESGENILDDALIENQIGQDGITYNDIFNESFEKHRQIPELVTEQTGTSLPPVSGLVPHSMSAGIRSCLTSENVAPRNKRKRGERKAGPCGWNPLPGEPRGQ